MFSFRWSVVLNAFEMSGKLRNNMVFLVIWKSLVTSMRHFRCQNVIVKRDDKVKTRIYKSVLISMLVCEGEEEDVESRMGFLK